MTNLLLLSNSTMPGTPFFSWPKPYVAEFLKDGIRELVFIPFAAVTISFDNYTSHVKTVFGEMGYNVISLHEVSDVMMVVESAQCILVGGGNSFALLSRMYNKKLIEVVKNKVLSGTPYIGWSAGANLACPTIMTTNDMPVVYPPSLNALNLVPFQINPHYHELKFENQGGETRKERLEEFLTMNPEKKVIGLPEGMLLQRSGDKLFLKGQGVAKLYLAGKPVEDLTAGVEVSNLLSRM
jgi:dipeptidase E